MSASRNEVGDTRREVVTQALVRDLLAYNYDTDTFTWRARVYPKRWHAANSKAWALGRQQRNGFRVRKVVWGLLMAKAELREGKEIRAATILVGNRTSAPKR
jgi:hypothetical protein